MQPPHRPPAGSRSPSIWKFQLIVSLIGLSCVVMCCACCGIFAITGWWDRQEELAHLRPHVSKWATLKGIDQSLLQESPVPEGALSGRCVIIEFDPKTDSGSIHDMHDGERTYLAWKARDVDFVLLVTSRLEETDVVYVNDETGKETEAKLEVLQTLIVDCKKKKVVGRFEIEGELPKDSYETSVVIGRVPAARYHAVLRQRYNAAAK